MTLASLPASCPFFRTETGGERERTVSLGGAAARPCPESPQHQPAAACGLSVLERPPGLSHGPAHLCPFRRAAAATEASSLGSYYYKDFFYGRGG